MNGIETKVAASGVTGSLLALLSGLAATYHWFTPPPPYLTALAVTVLSGIAAWLAPHTPRSAITGNLSAEIVRKSTGELSFAPGPVLRAGVPGKGMVSLDDGSDIVFSPPLTPTPPPPEAPAPDWSAS